MAESHYEQAPQYKKGPGKYDLTLASLEGRADVTETKASVVRRVVQITGEAQTFFVQTKRCEEGDFAFIEYLDGEGPIRLALPPKVMNLLARQRESLTVKGRVRRGKERARQAKASNKPIGVPFKKGGRR